MKHGFELGQGPVSPSRREMVRKGGERVVKRLEFDQVRRVAEFGGQPGNALSDEEENRHGVERRPQRPHWRVGDDGW
jgi:hypothetical protein